MFDLNLGLKRTETVKHHVSADGNQYDMMSAFNKLAAQTAQKFGRVVRDKPIRDNSPSRVFYEYDSKESITVVVGPVNTGSDTWRIVINTTETVRHETSLGAMVYAYDYEEHYLQSRVLCQLLSESNGQCKVKLNNGSVVYYRHYKPAK